MVGCQRQPAGRQRGTATRAEIHATQLRHRAVHVLVFDEDGNVYVQKRSLSKDCSPGLWDTSAAGHVDSTESYLYAAQRELNEELSLPRDTVLKEVAKLDARKTAGYEFVRVYRCEASCEPVPDPVEISDGRWITPRSLMLWIGKRPEEFTRTFREICSMKSIWQE